MISGNIRPMNGLNNLSVAGHLQLAGCAEDLEMHSWIESQAGGPDALRPVKFNQQPKAAMSMLGSY